MIKDTEYWLGQVSYWYGEMMYYESADFNYDYESARYAREKYLEAQAELAKLGYREAK